jgi:ribonuclease P protein component
LQRIGIFPGSLFYYYNIMPPYTLGKDQRLKSRKLIDRVFLKGKSFNLFPYRVWYLLEAAGPGRLQAGFGASRRNFKRAVDRNRIKRLTREAYRLQKGPLRQIIEGRKLTLCLFFIYTGKELPDHRLVSAKVGVALEKIVKEVGS